MGAGSSSVTARNAHVDASGSSRNGSPSMSDVMNGAISKQRSELFRYVDLEVTATTLRGVYELDGRRFEESVVFEGVDSLESESVRSIAELWCLLAGLSYYKAGAARRVDVGDLPLGKAGRALLEAALLEGLGEFAYRNQLFLDDVVIVGGSDVKEHKVTLDAERVVVPFGGGIDSVVTTSHLASHLDQALFIVSPASGRFTPLEETAKVTGLPRLRPRR